jgi:hypothetical protein
MPMRARIVTLFLLSTALVVSACHKKQQVAEQQNMSIDDEVATNGMPANADIEAVTADESSGTPTNQLQNGFDNPDVNANLGNSD